MTTPPRERTRPSAALRLADLDEVELDIDQLVVGGVGLGRFEGIAIFVSRSLPGDRLRVKIVERRPDYGRAEVVEVLQPGPGRREPPCPHYSECGGCDLQHLEDDRQAPMKAASVREALRRIGGIAWPEESELLVGEPWGYRLRCRLHTVQSEQRTEVGYHARQSRDVVPIERCPVLVPELESQLADLATRLGDPAPKRLDLASGDDGRWSTAPVVEGLPHGEVVLAVGEFSYSYDARCFFQAHRGLLPRLVEVVVGKDRGEKAFDLYAGAGLYSLPLARRYEKVVAVEGDRIAVRHARNSARRNGVRNLELLNFNLESYARRLPRGIDRMVVNPPRTGLSGAVRTAVLRSRPRRLTYVSCDPATLARDLRVLGESYRVLRIDLVDLFPQTGHIETVVQLEAGRPQPESAAE